VVIERVHVPFVTASAVSNALISCAYRNVKRRMTFRQNFLSIQLRRHG
jgi:hypothetical protein